MQAIRRVWQKLPWQPYIHAVPWIVGIFVCKLKELQEIHELISPSKWN